MGYQRSLNADVAEYTRNILPRQLNLLMWRPRGADVATTSASPSSLLLSFSLLPVAAASPPHLPSRPIAPASPPHLPSRPVASASPLRHPRFPSPSRPLPLSVAPTSPPRRPRFPSPPSKPPLSRPPLPGGGGRDVVDLGEGDATERGSGRDGVDLEGWRGSGGNGEGMRRRMVLAGAVTGEERRGERGEEGFADVAATSATPGCHISKFS